MVVGAPLVVVVVLVVVLMVAVTVVRCNRLGGWIRESLEIRENHFCGFSQGNLTLVKGTTVP